MHLAEAAAILKDRLRQNAHPIILRLLGIPIAGAGGAALSGIWARSSEFSYVIGDLALAGISVLSSWWPLVLGVDLLLVALWCLRLDGERHRAGHALHLGIGFLNRQVGHLELLFAWLTLVIVRVHHLALQLALVATLLTVGPLVLDGFGLLLMRRRRVPYDGGELLYQRRVFIYGFAIIGGLWLVLLDPGQVGAVAPLAVSLLAGIVVRIGVWERGGSPDAAVGQQMERLAVRFDHAVIVFALAVAILVPVFSIRGGLERDRRDLAMRASHWTDCEPDSSGPLQSDISLFVIADNQFHAVGGMHTGFQLDLVDRVNASAVRPIEQDLLSGVTLLELARRFHELARAQHRLFWAHLGDIGDLGCQSEIERFDGVIRAFGEGTLAGVAVGNHDDTFFGNLGWHPDWNRSCGGPHATRDWLHHKLERAGSALEGSRSSREARGSFLARVTPLGRLRTGAEVVAVFLDTTDFGRFRLGVAGLQGDISAAQVEWVKAALREHGEARVLLLGHHPYGSLAPLTGQRQFARLVEDLGPRLLAVISAHTHLAAPRRDQCIGGRRLTELVVGSTTDPPQEAALIEIGADASGAVALRVSTLPLVDRDGYTCASPPGWASIPARGCADVVKELKRVDACGELFGGHQDRFAASLAGLDPQCRRLALEWWPSLEPGLVHAQSPDELGCLQQVRARRLLACLTRDPGGSALPARPLQMENVFSLVEAQYRERPRELACLSWAAAIDQWHKREGWGFAQALGLGFDGAAAFGARRMLVSSRAQACGTAGSP